MAGEKPTLTNGFLGGQPRFSEMKLKTESHKSSTFKVSGNTELVKIKTGTPVKVVTKLTQCSGEKELPEYVFTQRESDGDLEFLLGFPESGWYKFQLFALPETDSAESLPNVYNYLIEVDNSNRVPRPFVKTYTKFFADRCYLKEPSSIDPNDSNLDKVKFKVKVPGAHKVAVHAVDEWFQLEKSGDKWVGTADLARFKTTGAKITLNANYDEKGTSYSVLLEYNI